MSYGTTRHTPSERKGWAACFRRSSCPQSSGRNLTVDLCGHKSVCPLCWYCIFYFGWTIENKHQKRCRSEDGECGRSLWWYPSILLLRRYYQRQVPRSSGNLSGYYDWRNNFWAVQRWSGWLQESLGNRIFAVHHHSHPGRSEQSEFFQRSWCNLIWMYPMILQKSCKPERHGILKSHL